MIVNNLPGRLLDISETKGKTIKDSLFYGRYLIQVFEDQSFIVYSYSGAYYEADGVEVDTSNFATYEDGATIEQFMEFDKELLEFLKENQLPSYLRHY